MELFNDTHYNYIAVINGREYSLKNGSTIFFDCVEGTRLELVCTDKPSVHINWLDVIIFKMLFGSTTITKLYANYAFTINDTAVQTIKLGYNDWSVRDQIDVKACFANSGVENEMYYFSNLEKVRKKHWRLHFFITSALPIGLLVLLACFLTDPPYLAIVFLVVWALFFAIPSFKEIKRFKQVMKPDFINEKLCEYASRRRVEKLVITDDTSKSSKFIEKIISKMFKHDDKEK